MASLSFAVLVTVVVTYGTFVTPSAAQNQPTVTVRQGALVGTTETFQESQFIKVNKTIDVFKGIPFAEPPVGQLRFRPPVAKGPWDGTYDATYFRHACVQDPSQVIGATKSEDCLHLNIFAPKPAVPGGAAVMVWIHGGGFVVGSGIESIYRGQALVALGDVIIVTINYRLNVFGFLTTDDETLPGNIGLMDQALALEWIKENIAAFGGDNSSITIFGESAGSSSVGSHVLSERSRGLFNRAIMESGTMMSSWAFSENKDMLRKQAFDIGERLGCSTSESQALVDCMREKDASELYVASDPSTFRGPVVVDGTFLVDTPMNLYATGRYNHADLLMGTNRDEGTLFLLYSPLFLDYLNSKEPPKVTRKDFDELLASDIYLGASPQIQDAIRMQYIDWSQADYDDHDYFRSYVDFGADFYFACGTDQVARFHFQAGDNVFLYQMTHVPSLSLYNLPGGGPGWLGCGHGEDISFIFGLPFLPETAALYFNFTDEERALSVEFMKFWTTFAKTGNPDRRAQGSNPPSQRDFWPRFTVPELEYKVLSLNLTTSRALKSDYCHFWNTYVPQLQTMLDEMDVAEREWKQAFSTWKYTDMVDWRKEFTEYKAVNVN
ncbi:acetylcholinesterase-like [Acanthaster planci]|uniref:Carboxylic ester hydrolase n=1 Tax=Acanthaster planci TaxID=133434 RepID=A0A8B7ZL17_ACAPL|nr:acetylcholinesterase-like [Acanthaster planci]